ncbi:MAG: cation transporter [Nitrospirae bacterium]|nr:cation transporter [Nitrospirota bacterium]
MESYLTLGLNLLVSCAKLVAGYMSGSIGMVADGFHSFFDASSNVIGLAGIHIAGMPPDESHPYGHKKYETFAAVGVALLLFLTCFELLQRAYGQFVNGVEPANVTAVSFAVMLGSMAMNIFVTLYETKKGREYGSDFLLADAGHTRSDILASGSVIVSLAAVRLGYPVADPIAALVIGVLIARVGFGIIKNSSDILCDTARIRSEEIMGICLSVPGVRNCHHVRSRGRDDAVCIDLRVHVDAEITAGEAHDISHQVEDRIRARIPGVYDVIVHIEPEGKDG